MYITVVPREASRGIADGLTYRADVDITPGSLVRIPVRASVQEGIVIGREDTSVLEHAKIRAVHDVLSLRPILPPHLLTLGAWIAREYGCSFRTVLAHMLPPPPWTTLTEPMRTLYRLRDASISVRGPKKTRIVDLLREKGEYEESALLRDGNASKRVIRELLDTQVIERVRAAVTPDRIDPYTPAEIDIPAQWRGVAQRMLTGAQKSVITHHNERERWILYSFLADRCLREGSSALLLVPEQYDAHRAGTLLRAHIAPERVIVCSADRKRAEIASDFRRMASGEPCVVIGTRSAIFSPLPNPGIVIIDQEHDALYKSERTPLTLARNLAVRLCDETPARLVLSSATPDSETWHRIQRGDIVSYALPALHPASPTIVDLREVHFGSAYPLSPTAIYAVRETLARKEQCVVFLNHRGSATGLLCTTCKRMLHLNDNGDPMTLHIDRHGRQCLRDHRTGAVTPAPVHCPHCGMHTVRPLGAGTQSVEKLLRTFFPDAHIVRLDSDIATGTDRRRRLDIWHRGEGNIIVGTQSILPALDAPGVTCAVALVADSGLSMPHLLAGERTMQHCMRLCGVLQRPHGRCIIQTFAPDAREMAAIRNDAVARYLDEELSLRAGASLSPVADHCALVLRGASGHDLATQIATQIRTRHPSHIVSVEPSLGERGVWLVSVTGKNARAVASPYARHTGVVLDPHPPLRF